jgi:rubrerythrin
MNMRFIFEIVIGLSLLFAYVKIEKRINQRCCHECGNSVSVDNPGETCPRCGALFK